VLNPKPQPLNPTPGTLNPTPLNLDLPSLEDASRREALPLRAICTALPPSELPFITQVPSSARRSPADAQLPIRVSAHTVRYYCNVYSNSNSNVGEAQPHRRTGPGSRLRQDTLLSRFVTIVTDIAIATGARLRQ